MEKYIIGVIGVLFSILGVGFLYFKNKSGKLEVKVENAEVEKKDAVLDEKERVLDEKIKEIEESLGEEAEHLENQEVIKYWEEHLNKDSK